MSEYEKPPAYSPAAQFDNYPGLQPMVFQEPPPMASHGPQPTTVQTQQPTALYTANIIQHSVTLGETPRRMVCPECQAQIQTSTSKECTQCQHVCCFLMFLTVGCSICSCLPYCCCSANVRHTCPNCHTHLGTFVQG